MTFYHPMMPGCIYLTTWTPRILAMLAFLVKLLEFCKRVPLIILMHSRAHFEYFGEIKRRRGARVKIIQTYFEINTAQGDELQ